MTKTVFNLYANCTVVLKSVLLMGCLASGAGALVGCASTTQGGTTAASPTAVQDKKDPQASGADTAAAKKTAAPGVAMPAAPETTEPGEAESETNVAPPVELVRDADALAAKGQYEKAIEQTRRALQRSEKYVPAMVIMARAYYHLGKYEFAESVCDIALNIDAKTAECYNLKGFISLKNQDDTVALRLFEKATQVNPGYGPGWLNLGAQYVKVKNFAAAITALERATEILTNRAEAFVNLGAAYRGENKLVQAQQAFNQSLRLRPNYPDAYFNLGLLYLDAETYPGLSKADQLNQAIFNFNRYKQVATSRLRDDPVELYVVEAQKALEREVKRQQRESQRKAREAAKPAATDATKDKANKAAAPAPAPATKPTK